jgi:dephospho-CoA kinase
MTIALGITGGIASGKTTVAQIFADAGIPVFDADAEVHAIYDDPPETIVDAFPDAVVDGKVDRRKLAAKIGTEPSTLDRLEAIVHPIIRRRAEDFLTDSENAGHKIAILEIPLLFETGVDELCDRILVTTVPDEIAATRLRERGMDQALYQRLTARQMPLAEKLVRAHYVVDTGTSLDEVRRTVGDMIVKLSVEAEG